MQYCQLLYYSIYLNNKKISAKLIIKSDLLCFIKNCDALNSEFIKFEFIMR